MFRRPPRRVSLLYAPLCSYSLRCSKEAIALRCWRIFWYGRILRFFAAGISAEPPKPWTPGLRTTLRMRRHLCWSARTASPAYVARHLFCRWCALAHCIRSRTQTPLLVNENGQPAYVARHLFCKWCALAYCIRSRTQSIESLKFHLQWCYDKFRSDLWITLICPESRSVFWLCIRWDYRGEDR